MINKMWPFSNANAATNARLWDVVDTHVAWTGMRLGKGIFSLGKFTAAAGGKTSKLAANVTNETTPTAPIWMSGTVSGYSQTTASNGGNAYTRQIVSPPGGVNQFKGLTQTTDNDKYVEVNCRQINPYFGSTAW